jgi:hypothetical protein
MHANAENIDHGVRAMLCEGMAPLDPRLDFQDDGGTPMWRARTRTRVTIDVHKRGALGAWRRMPISQQAALVVFFGLVAPFLIIFGGLVLLVIWDAITRHL